ncbi:unnamed protein product [Orchesella dallaii]|uniref:Cytochrome P450 n=1 Tax=Orchesella dallaii TaxID=48710 RepID=A0ABP1QZU4_9HEXA
MFAQTTLGIRMEDSKNPKNKFAQAFRTLIHEEVESNWIYSLSCYETTASSLSRVLYNMAQHPEVQEKMEKELKNANPPFYRPERILCGKDWSHNGISIKKGTVVMIPTCAANRNPKFYPDEPDKFKPERFLPENKGKLGPFAFTSFGF